jgi:enoyl-[acyl-carrier protein] reductase/trans-2-enoyl-CoA reductase (NAD+)
MGMDSAVRRADEAAVERAEGASTTEAATRERGVGQLTEMVCAAPRARGLFVLTSHAEGCRVLAERQRERASAAFEKPLPGAEGKTALVLGSTTFGYGSSTAISLRAAGFEKIIGVGYETAPAFRGEKLAISSPGWYLTHYLHEQGEVARTYLADAFAAETRDRVIADLREQGEKIDLVVYSVAAPRRSHLGQEWSSSLLVVGEPLDVLGLDYKSGELKPLQVAPADALQIEHTRRVMGGDDLEMWVSALLYSGLAAQGMTVTALSYIGPDLEPLRRMYWDGALGEAKKHIDATTRALDGRLERAVGGKAMTVMNPAVVTSASVAIPAMLRYVSDYLGVTDAGRGIYDDPLDVGIHFAKALYGAEEAWRDQLDEERRLRLDQHELEDGVQSAIRELWSHREPGTPPELTRAGLEVFKGEYMKLYGWGVEGVDYEAGYVVDPVLGVEQGVIDLIS